MSLTTNKVFKELKLENEELKHLLLKLMSKYKTSEIKRNVLLKRNAMLITDNKNLHIQLLDTTKKKIISEKAVATYQEAVKLLKNELKELKADTSSKCDKIESKSRPQSVVSSKMENEKQTHQKEESEPYFEVSDESVREGGSLSLKSYASPSQSATGTYLSDDVTEVQSPSSDSQKDDYVMCSEVEAYYQQMPYKKVEINSGEFENEVTKNKTESLASNDIKNEEKEDPFAHKRDRLWAQIKELREMTKVTDEELQTRRFAVAAKAEMIQNVHKEIKRMQTLITLAK